MIFIQHSYAIKCNLSGYKILSLINVHNAYFYKKKYHLKPWKGKKKFYFFFYINIYKRRTLWTIKENSSSPLVPDGLILLFA